MPRHDLYEISLESHALDDPRLSFVSDWAQFGKYLELSRHAIGYAPEQALVDLYRHSYGRAVDGLFAAGLTTEEANETLHRISPRLDQEVARMLERCRIGEDIMQAMRMAQEMALFGLRMPGTFTEAALEQSRQLLIRNLSPAQRQEFEANRHFRLEVRGRPFLIDERSTFNVMDTESGVRYCTRSAEPVPIYDLMLAQKLMLEVDPDSFFAVANDDSTAILPRPNLRIHDWPIYSPNEQAMLRRFPW